MTATVHKLPARTPSPAEVRAAVVDVYIAESQAWRDLIDTHNQQADSLAAAACQVMLGGDVEGARQLAAKYQAERDTVLRIVADPPTAPGPF